MNKSEFSAADIDVAQGKPPLLSIVTICWNHAEGLRRTLESVASQKSNDDLSRVEVIVIDGGSADRSVEVANGFISRFHLIVISEPDRGVYDAMNKGWSRATGRWVQFLNAGDTLSDPEVLWALCRALEVSDREWLVARTGLLGGDNALLRISNNVPHKHWRHVLGRRMHAHPSTFMTKELLERLGGFAESYRSAGDFDLVLRASLMSRPAALDRRVADAEPAGLSGMEVWEVPDLLSTIRRDRLWGARCVRLGEGPYSRFFAWRWNRIVRRQLRAAA